jgi:hypothetical protein
MADFFGCDQVICPETPSFITRVCGLFFIFDVVGLGKCVARGAIKLHKRTHDCLAAVCLQTMRGALVRAFGFPVI